MLTLQRFDTATGNSLQGVVICGGDVKFSNKVKCFRGLIIAGGKVICNSSISLSADVSYTASVLKKCADSTDTDVSVVTREILKNYVKEEKDSSAEVKSSTLSDISYSDILEFQNWKKNVD